MAVASIVQSYTPMQQGATLPNLSWSFLDDQNSPLNISGATLTLYLYDPDTNSYQTGQGSWNITNGSGGLATYTWNAADTAEPFSGFLVVHITLSGGGTYIPDPLPFEIEPLFYIG